MRHLVTAARLAPAGLVASLALVACDSPVDLRPAPQSASTALGQIATAVATQASLAKPRIYCVVEIVPRAVSCIDLPLAIGDPIGAAAIVRDADGTLRIGGQRANVTFSATGLRVANGIATMDVSVASHLGQALGTTDGTTADARGVRLMLVSGPSTIVGLGAVTLATAADGVAGVDGTAVVDGATIPFVKLSPALLAARATSATRPLSFRVPATVVGFSFGVYVSAPVPAPDGWVGLVDAAAVAKTAAPTPTTAFTVNAGRSMPLAVSHWDVAGRAITTATTTFASSAPTVATVDAAGTIRTVSMGSATITATSGARVGRAAVTVASADTPPPPDVTFTVDPARTYAISRHIYGVNAMSESGPGTAGQAPWYGATIPNGVTLNRVGGNRWSTYNWENNASNAGNDYRFQNDNYLSPSTAAGNAVYSRLSTTFKRNASAIVTVPMLPYVANDYSAVPLDTTNANRAARLAAHFVSNVATIGPVGAVSVNSRDGRVVQDVFVTWLQNTVGPRTDDQSLFFSLDNEPDLWHDTHAEIQNTLQTYDGFIGTTLTFARAVRNVAPRSMIFGPAVATYAGLMTLGRYPSPDPKYGSQPFVNVYLDAMRNAEVAEGKRLVDVLDVHWYPEAGTNAGTIINDYSAQDSAMIRARLQAPRSLWDPTYTDNSWVTQVTGGPIALIPRLRTTVAEHYPGTKLAITEYYYGRGGDISGGLAEADVLGIFGREGLFAATMWPQAGIWAPGYAGNGVAAYSYALGAFSLYRNFDGAGSTFGSLGYTASTTDVAATSVYASQGTSGQTMVVAINKTGTPLRTAIAFPAGSTFRTARVYAMSQGVPTPSRRADLTMAATSQVIYTMPAYSASMLVLAP